MGLLKDHSLRYAHADINTKHILSKSGYRNNLQSKKEKLTRLKMISSFRRAEPLYIAEEILHLFLPPYREMETV